MGFSKKIKAYLKAKNLTNRSLSKLMDGYSEALISRYTLSDEVSLPFVEKLLTVFPDLDYNYLLSNNDQIVFKKERNYVVTEESEMQIVSEPTFDYTEEKRLSAKDEIKIISDRLEVLSDDLQQLLSRI